MKIHGHVQDFGLASVCRRRRLLGRRRRPPAPAVSRRHARPAHQRLSVARQARTTFPQTALDEALLLAPYRRHRLRRCGVRTGYRSGDGGKPSQVVDSGNRHHRSDHRRRTRDGGPGVRSNLPVGGQIQEDRHDLQHHLTLRTWLAGITRGATANARSSPQSSRPRITTVIHQGSTTLTARRAAQLRLKTLSAIRLNLKCTKRE